MSDPSILLERLAAIPIFQTLHIEVSFSDDGEAILTAPYDARYDNAFNCVHGGIMTTLADSAAYVAVKARAGVDTVITTADLSIRFLAPCRTAVTAKTRIIKVGRTLCPVAVDLYDAQAQLIAVAQVTYFRM